MKLNRILNRRRNKVTNEALALRDNLETNQHYNIFVGDKKYKTDFWLEFLQPSSTKKYEKVIKRRFKESLKLLLGVIILRVVLSYIMFLFDIQPLVILNLQDSEKGKYCIDFNFLIPN